MLKKLIFAIGISSLPIILALITGFTVLRGWVYDSAFDGYSKSRIRKARKYISKWDHLTLLYTFKYQYRRTTMFRLVIYWLYSLYHIVTSILTFLNLTNIFMGDVTYYLFWGMSLILFLLKILVIFGVI